jgi:hypothetical protein
VPEDQHRGIGPEPADCLAEGLLNNGHRDFSGHGISPAKEYPLQRAVRAEVRSRCAADVTLISDRSAFPCSGEGFLDRPRSSPRAAAEHPAQASIGKVASSGDLL